MFILELRIFHLEEKSYLRQQMTFNTASNTKEYF